MTSSNAQVFEQIRSIRHLVENSMEKSLRAVPKEIALIISSFGEWVISEREKLATELKKTIIVRTYAQDSDEVQVEYFYLSMEKRFYSRVPSLVEGPLAIPYFIVRACYDWVHELGDEAPPIIPRRPVRRYDKRTGDFRVGEFIFRLIYKDKDFMRVYQNGLWKT